MTNSHDLHEAETGSAHAQHGCSQGSTVRNALLQLKLQKKDATLTKKRGLIQRP